MLRVDNANIVESKKKQLNYRLLTESKPRSEGRL